MAARDAAREGVFSVFREPVNGCLRLCMSFVPRLGGRSEAHVALVHDTIVYTCAAYHSISSPSQLSYSPSPQRCNLGLKFFQRQATSGALYQRTSRYHMKR